MRSSESKRLNAIVAICVLIFAYTGIWFMRFDIGLIQPCANLRYFYYSNNATLDSFAYYFFLPITRAQYAYDRWRFGDRNDIEERDRHFATFCESFPQSEAATATADADTNDDNSSE